MQAEPVDSTKMISAADHRWDEHESDEFKDRLLQLVKKLELQGKEDQLDDFHDHLDRMCKQLLQRLHEQEFLDSLQRKWETGEGLNRLVMKALEDVGKEQAFENLPQEEIERLFKVEIELNIKDGLERQMCTRWADYFQQSLGMQMQGLQALPDDLPEFRRQIDRLRRQSLQDWQHELLCIESAYLRSQKEFDKFSGSVDTNNVFSSIYVPNSLRVQAQGSHTNMEENVRTTVSSVGYAGDESSALLAVPTSVHHQFLLNNPGGEGSDAPRSNHAPTISSSTEANHVPLVDQLTANQSQDKREMDSACNGMPVVILDNQAQASCTGIFNVLSDLKIGPENIVLVAANGEEMGTIMSGSVCLGNFKLPNVHFCPDVGNRIIVSGSMLDNDGYGYEFGKGKFTVKDLKNDTTVGEGRLVDGNYILDYLKITRDRTRAPEQPGLLTTVWNAVCSALHRLGLKY